MKVLAIITAVLMAGAGAGYYVYTCDSCHSNSTCPLARSGGCCHPADAPQSCESPCSSCNKDCLECCDICEVCCNSGAQAPVNASISAASTDDEECCPHCKTPANVATSAVTAGVTLK